MEKVGIDRVRRGYQKGVDLYIVGSRYKNTEPKEPLISILPESLPAKSIEIESLTELLSPYEVLEGERNLRFTEQIIIIGAWKKDVAVIKSMRLKKRRSEEIKSEDLESIYQEIISQLDTLGIVIEEGLEHRKRRPRERYLEGLQEQLESLPYAYEDFVKLTYKALEKKYGKSPIDLTYDLLNEMARELYEVANVHPKEVNLSFDDAKRLGEQLRRLRTSYNISQNELSIYSSLARPLISYFETGDRLPNLRHILAYLSGLRRCVSERYQTVLTHSTDTED